VDDSGETIINPTKFDGIDSNHDSHMMLRNEV